MLRRSGGMRKIIRNSGNGVGEAWSSVSERYSKVDGSFPSTQKKKLFEV